MRRIDASTSEHLNALVDGELSDDEAEAWHQRIALDPALEREYARILLIKQSVSGLTLSDVSDIALDGQGPSAAKTSGFSSALFEHMGLSAIGLAAAAVAILAAGVLWFWGQTEGADRAVPTGAVAWHAALLEQDFTVEPAQTATKVSLGHVAGYEIPDLTGSSLFLVDTLVHEVNTERKEMTLHYSGLSGCRLTIWIGENMDIQLVDNIENLHRWSVGPTQYAVIATRMHRGRFVGIAEFVETFMRARDGQVEQQRLAMNDAYRTSTSCA